MIELRKSPVVFDAASHTYMLGNKELHGVTGTLIHRAFPDKYKGIDDEVLAEAARKGHELHEAIQNYDRYGISTGDVRLDNYERIKREFHLTTIENEYLVSDEQNYASSVDIVATNNEDEICLIDTKTTWNLDRVSVALQLSIYRRFFEWMNEGLQVAHLYALWLPNRDHDIAELVEVLPVSDDVLDALIKADQNDEPFSFITVPDGYDELEIRYRQFAQMKAEAEQGIENVKAALMQMMQEQNLTTIKSGNYTVSYIAEKVGQRFDSAAFKKDNKDLYNQYMKEAVTAASIRFTEVKK